MIPGTCATLAGESQQVVVAHPIRIGYSSIMSTTTTPPPAADLLRAALRARGWSPLELQRHLGDAGLHVSRQAVAAWCDGGGIADSHRVALADLLGLDVGLLTRALAARPGPR